MFLDFIVYQVFTTRRLQMVILHWYLTTDMQEKLEAKLRDIAHWGQTRIATQDLRGSALMPATFPAYLWFNNQYNVTICNFCNV